MNFISLVSGSSAEKSEIEGVLSIIKEDKLTAIANDVLTNDSSEVFFDYLTELKVNDHPENSTQHKTERLVQRTHVRTNSKTNLAKKNKGSISTRNKNSLDYYLLGNEKACQRIAFDVIRNLRNTYNCLIHSYAKNDVKILLNQKGFLELTTSSSYENTDAQKMLIQQDIYMNIISALKSGIFSFFDDKGHFIDLKIFERLVQVNFKYDMPIRVHTAKAFEAYYPKSKSLFENENKLKDFLETLCIPDTEIGKFNEHELFCIGILQRLYPENTDDKQHKTACLTTLPTFPPSVFLMVFKQFVSTSELLRIIQTLLGWSKKYVPTFQKVRLMNFLRSLVETFSYRFELKNHKTQLMEIVELGKNINLESLYLGEEIEDLLEFKGFSKKTTGTLNLNDFLRDVLVNNSPIGHYYLKMINSIADDLKILAAESMSTLTIEELYSDKKSSEPSNFQIHEDNLVRFIFSLFDSDKGKLNVEASLRFCYNLAAVSLEKNDYFTSYVIFICLSNNKIEQLYQVNPKKSALLPVNLIKKHKKFVLDLKTRSIQQELSELFMLNNNRARMNRKIIECNKRNILVVPEISLIKTSLMRMADEFVAHNDEIRINMKEIDIQTLHDTSDYMMKVESIMNNVLLFYKNSPDLQTNINIYL